MVRCPACRWSVEADDEVEAYVALYLHELNWPIHTVPPEPEVEESAAG